MVTASMFIKNSNGFLAILVGFTEEGRPEFDVVDGVGVPLRMPAVALAALAEEIEKPGTEVEIFDHRVID